MRVAENIIRLRKEKGWSQTELGQKIGSHLTHINRIETGKYMPSLEALVKIAEVFQVPLDYLVFSDEGSYTPIKIEDEPLAERMKLVNNLSEEDRKVVVRVIDAILTEKKMLDLLTRREVVGATRRD